MEEVSGAFAKRNHTCWKLRVHLRVMGPLGDNQVLSRKRGRNGQPLRCEGQKGDTAMWVPRREPGGYTGAEVGVAVSSSLSRRSGPGFGSPRSPGWGGHFLLWAAGSVSRRAQGLSWISSLLLSAPPSIPFSLMPLPPLTPG